ncbi:MAG: hypothetical protein ABUS79_20690, partial [Pseudomonadota bacterium]
MNSRVSRPRLLVTGCAVVGLAACFAGCGQDGGATQTGSGGAPASGGSVGAGGSIATGGAIGTGGARTTGTGGGASTGGTTGTGGASASGGRGGTPGSGGMTSAGGTTGTGGASASGGTTGTGGSSSGTCGAGDANLPAEPTLPATVCTTLSATRAVAANGVPAESNADTTAIQTALNGCGAGKAVKLVPSGSNNAFLTGPIKVPSGVTLWVDKGATLFGTRDPSVYGSASALITVSGTASGIVGDGVIDGQGGEPNVGSSQSWWDQNAGSSGNSPALIQVT